jgi:glycolate oxidase FAD binding subunit
VAVSIASVAAAVRAQGDGLERLATHEHGETTRARDGFWDGYDATQSAPLGDGIVVRVACLPTEVTAALSRCESLARETGVRLRASGCAPSGALRAFFAGQCPADGWGDRVVEPLRAYLAPHGGSAVVERCAPAVKAGLDVWGPVDPETLAVMGRIKSELDPGGILNPGRFVGRL